MTTKFARKKDGVVAADKFELAVDKPIFVKFVGPMVDSQRPAEYNKDNTLKRAESIITTALIEDLTNPGKYGQLIIPALLKGNLEGYNGGEYVGKSFEIIKKPKLTGKEYYPIEAYELDV